VEDVAITWVSVDGIDTDAVTWRGGSQWAPPLAQSATADTKPPPAAIRKREYLVETTAEESYDWWDRRDAKDSVNYYGWWPRDVGTYQLTARVILKDNQGKPHAFIGRTTIETESMPEFPLYLTALAVGDDHKKTGTKDLSQVIYNNLSGMNNLLPVRRPLESRSDALLRPHYPKDVVFFDVRLVAVANDVPDDRLHASGA
jgi:hypothetical protein